MSAKRTVDVETPITDKLIDDMLHDAGIPRCDEWDRMVAHAKEMESQVWAYRSASVALMRPFEALEEAAREPERASPEATTKGDSK